MCIRDRDVILSESELLFQNWSICLHPIWVRYSNSIKYTSLKFRGWRQIDQFWNKSSEFWYRRHILTVTNWPYTSIPLTYNYGWTKFDKLFKPSTKEHLYKCPVLIQMKYMYPKLCSFTQSTSEPCWWSVYLKKVTYLPRTLKVQKNCVENWYCRLVVPSILSFVVVFLLL